VKIFLISVWVDAGWSPQVASGKPNPDKHYHK
jgi:hypothetical protein